MNLSLTIPDFLCAWPFWVGVLAGAYLTLVVLCVVAVLCEPPDSDDYP